MQNILSLKQHLLFAVFSVFLILPLWAQDVAENSTEKTSLLGLLQQGGWAMFPLGLTALFMFFLIF